MRDIRTLTLVGLLLSANILSRPSKRYLPHGNIVYSGHDNIFMHCVKYSPGPFSLALGNLELE